MFILYTVAAVAAAVLVAALWALKAKPKPKPKQKVTVKRSVKPAKTYVPQPIIIPTAKRLAPQPSRRTLQLQQQLYQLLQGDKQAAERLIKTAQSRHPGHDPSWYLDKVINDLERDRRR